MSPYLLQHLGMRSVALVILIGMSLTSAPHLPQSTRPLYDTNKWTLVKRGEADLGKSGVGQVLLLKSVAGTDEGYGVPFYEVRLLIVRNGRVLFDYLKARQADEDLRFFVDDDLTIGDVTGDGVPEVIFDSGYEAVSDSESVEHILKYSPRTDSFAEVGEFEETGTQGLRWLMLGERSILVTSKRGKWPSANVLDQCHYCPSSFTYAAYEWSAVKNSFVRIRTIASQRPHHSGSEALTEEWGYIQAVLQKK